MKFKKHLEEVTNKCLEIHKGLKAQSKLKDQSHYKTNLELLGLNVPTMREIFKSGFSFSTLDTHEQFQVWDYIWKESQIFEVKSQALGFTGKMQTEDLKKRWSNYKRWVEYIDNWAHSDTISSDIAKLLEEYPKEIYPRLEKWNISRNPWSRRQSVVGLLYYAQSRKKIPPINKMLPLVQNLVLDEDYYVQKGVGWTLREIGNVNQDKLLKFVKKNISDLSSIAFTTSLEKIDKKVKSDLKIARTKARRIHTKAQVKKY